MQSKFPRKEGKLRGKKGEGVVSFILKILNSSIFDGLDNLYV